MEKRSQRKTQLFTPTRIAILLLVLLDHITQSASFTIVPQLTSWSSSSVAASNFALFAKSGTKKKKPKDTTIAVNRQARRNYEIVETLEAGISLLGTEVKSIRDGKMNLRDGFVKASKNGRGCTLMNVHIGKHSMSGSYFQHEERRPRELLVHKAEALKLKQKTEQSGFTIVPLKAYYNADNKIKIQIGLARGKNVRDKRTDIKKRDAKREENRIIKNFRV
jgi:SsrA-binding protein